jgi:hypothetical protein
MFLKRFSKSLAWTSVSCTAGVREQEHLGGGLVSLSEGSAVSEGLRNSALEHGFSKCGKHTTTGMPAIV